MSISGLHAKADRLEKELREPRDQIARETHDSEVVTAELARTRAYAFSAQADPGEEMVAGCADSLSRYGFCVFDNAIRRDHARVRGRPTGLDAGRSLRGRLVGRRHGRARDGP